MPPRKPKPWSPPAGLKIEVGVSRGDLFMKAESTPTEAVNVARMLTAMVRMVTGEAPDLLPHADSVPGMVLGYDWAEDYAESGKKAQRPPKRVGF
jgi:hypothetical protein